MNLTSTQLLISRNSILSILYLHSVEEIRVETDLALIFFLPLLMCVFFFAVTELSTPFDGQRMIPPADAGGVAGGEKYIWKVQDQMSQFMIGRERERESSNCVTSALT